MDMYYFKGTVSEDGVGMVEIELWYKLNYNTNDMVIVCNEINEKFSCGLDECLLSNSFELTLLRVNFANLNFGIFVFWV